jgi:Fe-S-cluster containining protein
MEPIDEDSRDLKDICAACGGVCCKLGGVVATRNEVDAIIDRGYQNYFIEIADSVYGTEWGDDGVCPYFRDNECSIHEVRPLGCRLFPVVQTTSRDILLIECPLAPHLSREEIQNSKIILSQRPDYITRRSEHLREEHAKELQMRISRFNHVVL